MYAEYARKCPFCNMTQDAGGRTQTPRQTIQGADAPEISVTLARDTTRLRFVDKHLEELRAISGVVSRTPAKSTG